MPNRPRILYVDDDPDLLRLFQMTQRNDFDVDVASSGQDALRMVGECDAYAVVVSDMRMPRMNGAQLLGMVREIIPHAVRILLTGDADLDSAMAAVNEGYVFRYLTKPCPRSQMHEVLQSAVAEHKKQRSRDGLGNTLSRVPDVPSSPGKQSQATPPTADDERPEEPVKQGTIIAGRYEVERLLGVGSSSTVYQCQDEVLQEQVALKLFPSDASDRDQARIRQEIVLTRQLVHNNIIRVFDIGVDMGRPFMTMELLRGKDLAEHITPDGMQLGQVVDILSQACAGLSYAHAQNVLHRDVKPENLFISRDGTVYLTDFGLAKRLSEGSAAGQEAVVGTTHYMAPEQFDVGQPTTAATDIYALGVVTYELLAGQAPFEYETFSELKQAHERETATPLTRHRPDLPTALDLVLARALAKNPAARYPGCDAFAAALQSAATEHPHDIADREAG